MKYFTLIIVAITTLIITGCEVTPQPIEYGSDACSYCDMTIVDPKHASQVVTKKGKNYKYDAVECMVHSIQDELKETPIAIYLVADFNNPGQLTDATKAGYLVSNEIRSPMGANLASFTDEDKAATAQQRVGGEVFSWDTIREHLKL